MSLPWRSSSRFDADAREYFLRVAASGAALSSANFGEYETKVKINAFFVALKGLGLWPKIRDMGAFLGVGFTGIFEKLKGNGALTNYNFVSGDYYPSGSSLGLKSDGATKYLSAIPNLRDAGMTPSSCHLTAFFPQIDVLETNTAYRHLGMPVEQAFVARFELVKNSLTNNNQFRTDTGLENRAVELPGATSSHAKGFYGFSQESLSFRAAYFDGAVQATSTGTSSKSNFSITADFRVFQSGDIYSPRRIAFYSVGGGLTPQQMSDFSGAVFTLMREFGYTS